MTTSPPAGPSTPTRPSCSNAVGSPLVIVAVGAGLVAWTLVMASGLVPTFRRR